MDSTFYILDHRIFNKFAGYPAKADTEFYIRSDVDYQAKYPAEYRISGQICGRIPDILISLAYFLSSLSISHLLPSMFMGRVIYWLPRNIQKKNLCLTLTILSLSYVHPLSHSLSFSHKLTHSFLPSMFLFMGRVIFWLFRNIQKKISVSHSLFRTYSLTLYLFRINSHALSYLLCSCSWAG